VFERFTERARQVVVLSQDEARQLGHNYIGTEHLLLGLLREEEGIAARVLESLRVDLDGARERVGEVVGRGDEVRAGQIPYTPRAKRTLELALDETQALGEHFVATEHLLLGLVRLDEGVAARVLLDFDVDAATVRSEVLRAIGPTPRSGPSRTERDRPPPTPGSRRPDWEYRIDHLHGPDELSLERLNECGAEGWELAAVVPAENELLAVFKRGGPPRRPPPPPPPPPRPRR
jgi:ATP-dependent Clp protease ATP-binding subunit ClpA